MHSKVLANKANVNSANRTQPFFYPRAEAERLIAEGKRDEALEVLVNGDEFEAAIRLLKIKMREEDNPIKLACISAKIAQCYDKGIKKAEEDDCYRTAGRLALEIEDDDLAIKEFKIGGWLLDAAEVERRRGNETEAEALEAVAQGHVRVLIAEQRKDLK